MIQDKIVIRGAREHNLQDIDVAIPLGCFVAVTGVSGSGKSTLIRDILLPSMMQKIYKSKDAPGKHRTVEGIDAIDKVIDMDPGKENRKWLDKMYYLPIHRDEMNRNSELVQNPGY